MSLFFFGLACLCFGYAAGIIHSGWRTFNSFNEGYNAGFEEGFNEGIPPEGLPRDHAEISGFEL